MWCLFRFLPIQGNQGILGEVKMTNTLFINGKQVEYTNEKNLLEVIRKAGFQVPTLCYRPDLTQFGACRMCVVEIEYPNGRVVVNSSCTAPPEPNINVKTNTDRVRKIRKTVLELLLSNHDRECTTCDRSGTCELQKYAEEYGIKELRYAKKAPEDYLPLDTSNPSIVRDSNKCILCGACVRACSEYQGHSVLGFANRGSKTVVQPMAGKELKNVDCVLCGQCKTVCPTGALTIRNEINEVWDEINNPNKKVVVQVAPAVRVAIGEMFNIPAGENVIGKLYAAMRRIGFDLVFDTNFAADLTIMEEASEFLERVQKGENLPLFTSCCQAWVKYVETHHPDMIKNLSSCKSPQSMLSSVVKYVLPKTTEGYTDDNIVVVSVMPCSAKKAEIKRKQLTANGKFDTDYVLTTQEFGQMIKSAGLDLNNLEPEEADSPFGQYTGAATIFGASGGVAEAAARTAYYMVTGENIANNDIKELRGVDEKSYSKVVELDIKGTKVKIKVVSTLREAEKAIQEIKNGTADFQLLEVMACPGGCVNGGGQPISCNTPEKRQARAEGLYNEDLKDTQYRRSHENTDIKKLYDTYLEKPNSHKAHELLHTSYSDEFAGSYRDLK
ncbi:MAG: 4Fe-4S dicluster domain-containing protein [Cyanobacteria bacterium SIG30]|nr:4Fe-4S dicluster domain-containing protein [Cyanobacteria bacterium SIG30]